jgi:hypothetical protein
MLYSEMNDLLRKSRFSQPLDSGMIFQILRG